MNPPFVVVPMSADDLPEVTALERDAFDAAPSLEEELARPWARLWVAKSADPGGGTVLGFVLVWHVADELHLLNVATSTAFRRRGVGRALVGHVVAYASRSDVAMVILEVRPSNVAAIGLYRSFGFVDLGKRKNYYPDGEDALELVLRFGAADATKVP
ncbi:MAG: ribosomal protein S18-alanine N-acetyltransferase [Polyangiaceae bacterium]